MYVNAYTHVEIHKNHEFSWKEELNHDIFREVDPIGYRHIIQSEPDSKLKITNMFHLRCGIYIINNK